MRANCEKCSKHRELILSASPEFENTKTFKKLNFRKTQNCFKKLEKSRIQKSGIHNELFKLRYAVDSKSDSRPLFPKKIEASKINKRHSDKLCNEKNGLLHARTISWPLFNHFSICDNDKSASDRTVIWVSNTFDVMSSGESFIHKESDQKKEVIPSITISSSSETDVSPPTSLSSNSASVFNVPTRGQQDFQANFLNLQGFASPASSRRYSGDSGYSGTQSTSSEENSFLSRKSKTFKSDC